MSLHNKLLYVDFELRHIMRHQRLTSEKASRMGRASQAAQENDRLAYALSYRPTTSYLVFELDTHNPRTGQRHHIEIRHEMSTGNNRYAVYLDGERWRNGWSRTRFIGWLFRQIDSVRVDWS
jgi:hypothetical protein